jgi:beta-xylosidase
MKWENGWPVIGIDKDGDGKGEPVLRYKKPNVGKAYPIQTPAESDEFNGAKLGLQWQWMANPKATWAFVTSNGSLRLFSDKLPEGVKNLWDAPNVLLQKFPAEEFMVTTKMTFKPNLKLEAERAGLIIMGLRYASIGVKSSKEGNYIVHSVCKEAAKGKVETEKQLLLATNATVYFRVKVTKAAKCNFSYSFDGTNFTAAGEEFTAEPGRWKGAKVGLFCTRETQINDAGWVDVDWFRVEPLR